MDYRDFFERLFWTAVAAVLGVIVVAAGDLPVTYAPLVIAAANALLQVVRAKAPFLPSPGEGLPGLRKPVTEA